ncbi:MAG: CoA transferase [Burkholderiaceae bacterium]
MQPATSAALEGLFVLDLSRVLAGPLCTQCLGDMGAEVIKVESIEGGDDTRGWPVLRQGAEGALTSAPFLWLNRNKRSIAIDLKAAAGRELILRLARRADVVVESFAPGAAARLGIDAPTLRAINPRLVYCSISGFGSVGPMREGKGYDLILQAFSGMLSITGDRGSPPMRSPFSPVDHATGLHASIGILAALHSRQHTGAGCMVEASLFDTAAALMAPFLQNYFETHTEPEKAGVGHGSLCPYGLFETADKPIILGAASDALWRRLCPILGINPADAVRFASTRQRVDARAQVEALVQAALRRHKRAHWFSVLDDAGIPCSPMHTVGEFAAHPHTAASGMLASYDDPHFGRMQGIAQPLRFDGARAEQRRIPPLLGEHTIEVLREAGLGDAEIDRLIELGVVKAGDKQSFVSSTLPLPAATVRT